ncbi:MAG: efflux RND transporter permease subunit [Pseudomonadota bacterium]
MTGAIRWFLRSPVAANLLMVGLVAAGLAALTQLTVRTFPEIATNSVTVTVVYPGASPSEVADAILTPIEEQLESLEGVRELTGNAVQGLGTVTAELTQGADLRAIRDDIETEIARITTFPAGSETPRVTEVDPTELAVQFVFSGDVSAAALKAVAERARDGLVALPSVSQVSLVGVSEDLIEIEISRADLETYGLTLTQLGGRLSAEVLDLSGGTIRTGATEIQVRTLGDAEAAATLRDRVLFTDAAGGRVRLGDVADVREASVEGGPVATLGDVRAVFLSVNRAGGEQVLAVADAATAYIEDELRPSLPPGIDVALWRDEADSLRGRISLLAENAAIGLALILAILTLFLDLRVAFWVAVGVAVTFVGAFAPMLFFGTTVNQLSLFGFILALGIVVDDAIVVGENSYAELEKGDAEDAADRAVMRVWRPIVFAVTTSIAAFVPLLLLPGSSGSFIAPVAAVVIYLLCLSMIESFFVLPRHLSHIRLTEPRRYSPRRVTDWLRDRVDDGFTRTREKRLRPVVEGATAHPVFAIVACLAVSALAAGALAGGKVKFVFFPEIEGNFVTATLTMPDGTAPQATAAAARRLSTAAATAAEEIGEAGLLRDVAVSIGFSGRSSPDGGGGTSAGSVATVEARLKDSAQRETAAEAFRQAWSQAAGAVPGARSTVYSASAVGVGAAISLEVAAEEEAAREEAAARIRRALEGRPGVRDIRDDRLSAAREVAIRPLPAAEALGVTTEAIATEVRAALFGAVIDQFARDREEVDIRLRLPSRERNSIAALERLRIPTPEGGLVPLAALAELDYRPAPTEIVTKDGARIVTVQADVDAGITTGGVETAWVQTNVVPEIARDLSGVTVSAGGEQEEAARFGQALAFNFALALMAIYAILTLAFGSFTLPLIVIGVIPFGFFGAVFGHWALGLDLTLLSMFGVVGLAGVIVNDALLIVDYIKEREDDGDDPLDAVSEATLDRFRPVMLTTLTTFLGITPLVLETSVQAQFLIPTAVALGGGVLFVAILQMVLVPAFASLHARAARRLADGDAQPT